ncbi:hypothetical protein [Streptomyces sp. NPDC019224]|uniref:hypothetical protein n=1 Tax=Streptomyces sp. NPDC019224 TaxID=3154484 RepID=UPI0033E950D7
MSKNTACVRERAEESGSPPSLWTARAIVSGAAALFVGAELAFEVYGFAELAMEAPTQPDGPASALLMLPFLMCFGGPFALLGSLLLALPTVSTARWVSARTTGADTWWWVPVVAVVAVSAVVAAVAVVWHPGPGMLALTWLTSAVLLAGAALLARHASLHGRRLLRVFGYGALAGVAMAGLAGAAFGTGLVTEYRPPEVDAARLVGTWSDGRGGVLRLAADGTARAEGLTDHESAYEDDADAGRAKYRCTGPGTWAYEPGNATTWDQRLNVSIERCGFDDFNEYVDSGWLISGTPERPKLVRLYGDLDAPGMYTLTR